MASQPHSLADVLRGALTSLREVVPYDLAAVYERRGERLVVRAAEGPLANARVRRHELELAAFPTVRRALELRRPVLLDEHQHAGEEGDPYDGILDLPPGHACMVVPLFAADRSLGIITLDRTACGAYSPEVVQLAGVYGQIVSIALLFAEQAQVLGRLRHQLREENLLLHEEVGSGGCWSASQLEASRSASMRQLCRTAKQVAPSELPVLVSGETGTGKEVLAQAIHAWSGRAGGPFIKLNCAAIAENLVETELFGHVKGAFSGAQAERRGRFLTANGGTLLLDEVGDMPLGVQAKLLRVLQEGTFEPVGSDTSVRVDVRVVAATHVDLLQAVRAGRFREDLYYRLAGFPLHVPALRERREEIEGLAQTILDGVTRRSGRGGWSLSARARAELVAHAWPGNVRELVNVLERATILQPCGEIGAEHLVILPSARPPKRGSERTSSFPMFEEMQRRYFTEALQRAGGRIYGDDGAATLVGIKPTTLQSRLKRLGLDPAKSRG